MPSDCKRVLRVMPSDRKRVLHVLPSDCKHVFLTVANLYYALYFVVNRKTERRKCMKQYSWSCRASALP